MDSLNQMIQALRELGGAIEKLKPVIYQRKKSGKTRRGAKHNHRSTFRSRRVLNLTPAQYRHSHRGNMQKAAYEKNQLEKRKWISQQ